MANAITNINDDILSKAVLDGFVAAVTPLTAFSTSFSNEAVKKGDKVSVPRVGVQDAAATKTNHGAYTIQDSDSDAVEITLGQPVYVSSGLDDVEIASSSVLSLELYGKSKGAVLAKKIMQDILSKVTLANFGAHVFAGAASTFDSDDVIDIRTLCSAADMPIENRALLLDDAYVGALLKDAAVKSSDRFGSTNPIREGSIGRIAGFDVFESTLIPTNSENLIGIAAHPAGLAIAMRYLQPQAGNTYSAAYPVTDAKTGITIGVREGYDNLKGVKYKIWEAVYGYEVGIAAGIKRLLSAAPQA
jgi:hypothetical protein